MMKIELENVLPREIEKRSFELITEELGERTFPEEQEPIIKRCIHTSADFDYADNLCFSEGVVEKAKEAIRNGACIVTDTQMAKSGINKKKLAAYGGEVFCFMSDEDVAERAKKNGTTRATACMDKAAAMNRPLIFAIGNAPTALIRLYELIEEKKLKPELVIGVLWYLWKWICARFGVGTLCYTVVGTAIPILITGGFHVDGFLDTCDALHSYQPRERKLEILKDSHIGAFAVIMLTLYGLIFLGGFSEITECRTLVVAGAGSFLSRVLSGVAVVSFPSAKQEGTLYLFADKAHKRVVKTALYAQGILCIGFMMWTSFVTGGIAVAAALLTFAYYYYRSKKEFGGITGDTAGYFVTFCEGCVVVAAAIAEHMMLTV